MEVLQRKERPRGWGDFLGGWKGLVPLILFIFSTEALTVSVGGDAGGFWWVTFHFILSPLYCIVHITVTCFNTLQLTPTTARMKYLSSILLPLAFLYIVFAGNVLWLRFFNIDFNK